MSLANSNVNWTDILIGSYTAMSTSKAGICSDWLLLSLWLLNIFNIIPDSMLSTSDFILPALTFMKPNDFFVIST